MQNRYLPVLFVLSFCLCTSYLQAQNTLISIQGPSVVCEGDCVTLTAVATGQPASQNVTWFGPNNFTSTQSTVVVCPVIDPVGSTSNTVTYRVTIQTPNGILAIDTHNVTILPAIPLKVISSNSAPCNFDTVSADNNVCEKVCPNTTVTYSLDTGVLLSGGIGFLFWQVVGASSFTVNNPPFNNSVTVQWSGPGVGSVSVGIDGNPSYCVTGSTICVTIVPEPVAQFSTQSGALPLQICKGQTVYFTNQSTGADSYEWLFSDNNGTSNEINPAHTYFTPGLHTISLIARSACLCADTLTQQIEVIDAESPALDCIGTICPNTTVTYTVSSGCTPFSWAVSGNGTVLAGGNASTDSITVMWGNGPVGMITLGAQPCSGMACPIPSNLQIPIISDNAEIAGPDRVCPESREVYRIEPYGGAGFTWTVVGDGVISEGQGTHQISITWGDQANPGADQLVIVEYDNCYLGCGGKDTLVVKILSPFVLSGPVELCENGSGNFSARLTSNNQLLSCNWTLRGPAGTVVWTSPGPAVTVSPVFAAGAGVYQLLALPANVNATCSNQAEWVIRVAALPPKPGVIVGIANICPNTAYTYNIPGVSSDYNVRWTVKNGPAAAQTFSGNPLNITWNSTGPYSIAAALVSTNGLNCISDTLFLPIQSINLGSLSGDTQVCSDSKGQYSLPPLGNIPIVWSVSPSAAGAVADGQGTGNATIFWSDPGGHVVSVAVCGQTAIFPVTVLAHPVPMVSQPLGVCPGGTVVAQTTTSFSTYNWFDENNSLVSTASMPVLGIGTYAISVADGNGCVGTSEFSVETLPIPNLSISTADPTGFCNNSLTVSMVALVTNDADYTYQWFQDGTPTGGNTSSLSTNQYGAYTCQVSNQYGCTATAGPITLFNYCGGGGGGFGFPGGGPPPCPPGSISINIDPSPACDSFDFNVIGPQFVPGTANWTFGQSGAGISGVSVDDSPSFTFSNAGKYIVLLTAQLTNGSFCVVLDSLDVIAVAQFSVVADCPGELSTFKDISTFLQPYSLVSWNWNFDDPATGPNNTSFLNDPSHAFNSGGTFDVSLTITTTAGCTSTGVQAIDIPVATPLNFALPSGNCAGNALEFTGVGNSNITNISWDFGDPASGAANDAIGTPVYHNFSPPGIYTVTATTTNIYGCTATFPKDITIQPNGLSGNITPGAPAPLCEGSTVTLTAPAGAVSYLWSDGVTTSTTLTVGQEGVYGVTLTDANGCTYAPPVVKVEITPSPDALIKALLQNQLGQVIGTVYPSLSTCFGEDVHLVAVGNGVYGYNWSGGNGNTVDVYFSEDRNNLLSIGTHLFTVTVTDFASGCTAVTAPFEVVVHPVPSGFSIASNTICASSTATLTYSGPNPGNWQFIWNNGAPGTSLTTDQSGAYYIRVVNEFGCEARSGPLVLLPGPPVGAIPAGCHRRCTPDTLCLPPMPTVVSWQWFYNGTAISGATGQDFVATQSGVYWAELTDIYGCNAQSDPLNLDLYQGTGDVLGQVWSDVNHNGLIDAADTLISGIPVLLIQNGTTQNTAISDATGGFSFADIPSVNYIVSVDLSGTGGSWQPVIGSAIASLTGCDDLENTDLLVEFVCQTAFGSALFSACNGDVIFYNGVPVIAGSSQVFTLSTVLGCDSLVTVTVDVLPVTSGNLSVKTCPGTPYFYQGVPYFPGETGVFMLQNALGCDSILTLSVGAYTNSASSLDVKVCPGETYDYFGSPVAIGQSINVTFQNYLGCDSVVTVTVSALPALSGAQSAIVCPGETYDYFGTLLNGGDVATFTFSSVMTGCDSVVTVSIGTFPILSGAQSASVCPGETYDYFGTLLNGGDVATFTFSSVITGCDSVVTVTVQALAASMGHLDVSACPGESYDFNGTPVLAGTVKSFILVNAVGCDSFLTVSVAEKPLSFNTIEVTVCPGETYNYNGILFPSDTIATFVFQGFEGCDSTVTLLVKSYPALVFSLETTASCRNTDSGSILVNDINGGLPPYGYSLDGVLYQGNGLFEDLAVGNYTLSVEDANGCIFEQDASVEAIPALQVLLTDAVLPCDTAAVLLAPLVSQDSFIQYQWWNGATTPQVLVNMPGNIWVEVSNTCETVRKEAAVAWADADAATSYVFVPNSIAPQSANPLNTVFKPFFQAGIQVLDYQMAVFDRWGNKLFETTQLDTGWDTIYRSQSFQPGVLVWYLEAKVAFCGREFLIKKEGDVTIVR